MIKKIDVIDLKQGMYVRELDRSWRGTPFLFQGFEIRTHGELELLRHHCKHVYIDTALGDDIISYPSIGVVHEGTGQVKATEEEGKRLLVDVVGKTSADQHQQPRYQDKVTLEEELGPAQQVDFKARVMISDMMEDARLGKSLGSPEVKYVVTDLTESILRNPDALVCLTHLKNKDDYTALHCLRVSILALAFGRHLGLEKEALNIVGIGGLLADIGKSKIPREILNKPASLTAHEYELVRKHVPRGVEILENIKGIPAEAIKTVQHHHEWYDGSGYMKGLKGDAIGLYGLMGGIIDWYDAVTSERPYRSGISPTKALTKMYRRRNRNFHPALVEKFVECMGIYPIGSVVEFDTREVGVVLTGDRARRLSPKVAVVLDSEKQPYLSRTKLMELGAQSNESPSKRLEIKRVLPAGAYNINPTDYLLPGDLKAPYARA